MARRAKAQVTVVKPVVSEGVLRVREYLRDRTLPDVVECLLAVMRVGRREDASPVERQQALSAAELLLSKVVGHPKEPFDEETARGTIMVAQDMALSEAAEAMRHLSSMPLERYMELAERGVAPALPANGEAE